MRKKEVVSYRMADACARIGRKVCGEDNETLVRRVMEENKSLSASELARRLGVSRLTIEKYRKIFVGGEAMWLNKLDSFAREYIETHCGRMTITELANMLGVSNYYIAKYISVKGLKEYRGFKKRRGNRTKQNKKVTKHEPSRV